MSVCRTSVQDKTSVVGVGVQDKCCGCQCTGHVCGCQSAGHFLWVSVCRTSMLVSECRTSAVGVSVQDKCLWVLECRTSVVGVSVQDKCCGCRGTGQVLWVSVYRTIMLVSVCRTSVVGVSVHAGHLLWVSVCSPAWLFAEQNRVCRMHVLLLAGRCEPIWAHGALQDQELNQEPSSCLLFVLVGTFFSLSFLGILG
jgi:hypothetical protein